MCHTTCHGEWLPSIGNAADRRPARLLRHGPRGLPRVRAPHQPRSGRARRAHRDAHATDREIELIAKRGLRARRAIPGATSRRRGLQVATARASVEAMVRRPTGTLCGSGGGDRGGHARGAQVIYQATLLRWHVAGHADFLHRIEEPGAPAPALGATRSRTPSWRARRRRRVAPDVRLQRPAGTGPRGRAAVDGGRARRQRSGDRAVPGRRLHGLLPNGPGADSRRSWWTPRRRIRSPPPIPNPSTIAMSAAGPCNAGTQRRRMTTCRS